MRDMSEATATSCLGCQGLQVQVEQLRGQLEQQHALLEALQATIARLQEQLASARKDSSTSSKPPSSDIVKPPRAPAGSDATPRQQGGQPGHPKHERAL